ncbi:Proton-coupled folate transporter [Armadillidium vulgare]|nr:Proton-coupled folate transporter [Armadillidium vulgare]
MKEKKRNLQSYSRVFSSITLEPMLFLKMVAESNYKVVGDTLEIDRICRVTLNYTDEECKAMDDGNHTDIQNEVQVYQNNFNYNQTLMDSFIPLLVVLLVGPMSDKYGRKPAMISVLLGFIGLSLVYTLTALNPSWPVQVLYLGNIFVTVGGTWVVFNMAVYSYLADITTTDCRTKRMGFADAIWYAGSPLGTMIGGFLFHGFGYAAVFILSTVLWILCLIYTIFLVKESRQPNTDYEEELISGGRLGPLKYVLSLFKTGFKSRPGNARLLIIGLIILKLGGFLVQGHQVYLWARKVLQWNATQYSTWSGVEEGSHQLGMVAWVWFGERVHLHDCTIANGGFFSILLWSVTLACITGPSLWWLVIVASALGLLEASIEPAIRSMLTAVVGVGEEGRILSMLGILESVWLSADRALYTSLYNACVESFTQINFVVQAGFAVVMIFLVMIIKRSLIKNSTRDSEVTATAYRPSEE